MHIPRILIVEDEIIVALNLKSKLTQKGYHIVDLVASGGEAVTVAMNSQLDLILMDIRLKGELDGIDAAIMIKAKLEIPIIFLTAYIDETTKNRAKSVASEFLYKPFDAFKLYNAVDAILNGSA